jgi:pimeloyl-ACP methyl ester carboxylesterase
MDRRSSRFGYRLSLFLFAVGMVGVGSIGASAPAVAAPCDGEDVEVTTLTASDRVRIAAYTSGAGDTALILVHQVNQDHCGWAPMANKLSAKYRVMSIDLRGYGRSGKGTAKNAVNYSLDIAAAVSTLREEGAERVFVIGASMGASAAIVAGSVIVPPVDGVVAVSASGNFKGQNALAAAPRLVVPVRFVAAEDDGPAAATATRLDALSSKSPDHDTLIFATGGHGWRLLAPDTPAEKAVIKFIGRS